MTSSGSTITTSGSTAGVSLGNATPSSTRIDACRICGGSALVPILDLGAAPLANSLPTAATLTAAEETFPLAIVLCTECSLLQLTETVDPEKLFGEYLYFSSFSDTMVQHAKTIAERLIDERKLGPESLACEIASNDGYLLQHYKNRGIPVLGVEPARNVAAVAIKERGVETLCEFFGSEVGARLRREGRLADVIHANNVVAHVADLNGVMAGFASWLKDDGVAVIEAPYVKPFLDHAEFDTIYHEHLCYFSLTSIETLAARHGMYVSDVEPLAIHGGTLRYFVSRKASGGVASVRVTTLLAEETAWHCKDPAAYRPFVDKVAASKHALTTLLRELKSQGKSIAAYGAAAKGATLLNYFGIGADVLDFVVDRSTHKQGRFMPGVRVPILAPEELAQRKPDFCLLLTWNFRDEILKQMSGYREAGGKFIVPNPILEIV